MVTVRLYLSSYGLGDHSAVLSGMVRGDRCGWVISNALDALDAERRERETRQQIAELAKLGLSAVDLDLRLYRPDTITDAFGEPDFVWVRGGNVFMLRAALERSGADALITSALDRDAFVYGGFSAGACVLAPSLAGLELCDPVEDCLALYGSVPWSGLGVLDRAVVPHLASPGHPESAVLEAVARGYGEAGVQYWALQDGDVLACEDGVYRHLFSRGSVAVEHRPYGPSWARSSSSTLLPVDSTMRPFVTRYILNSATLT
jgi:dipeptidase E